MFSKILIANRGEIAVRIIRACREMGIKTVQVFSEADRDSLAVALADESYCIGPASVEKSYLNQAQILRTALMTKAEAIHPGYGFLSENAHFAEECRKNGIAFIGPPADFLLRTENKAEMKKEMAAAGLPTIPGSDTLKSREEAIRVAEKMGYPVMLKAVSGGGGKGIRLLYSRGELREAYPLAEAEAKASFGDPSLYLEKYVFPARHIEVQVIADEAGHVLCLGERDCSVQRRHQKLIEETPSAGLDEKSRRKLFQKVTKAVRSMQYTGVGTLEFLLDEQQKLWFMEMNVRLQVEHGITELYTGLDLVKWQIRTAAGVSLPFSEEETRGRGYALECRINALSPGTVQRLHIPGGPFIRFDTALMQGTVVTPFYDSLLGKMMVYAVSREELLRKMKAALCELVIEGVETNIEEQLRFLEDPRFVSGNYDLRFLEG